MFPREVESELMAGTTFKEELYSILGHCLPD